MKAIPNAKSCPWCYHDDVLSRQLRYRHDGDDWVIECMDCGCVGPPHYLKAKCLKEWNKRENDTSSRY